MASDGGLLLSHPHGAAVTAGLATALASDGRLAAYCTGVGAISGTHVGRTLGMLAKRWPAGHNRTLGPVLAGRLHAMPAVELAARTLGQVISRAIPWVSSYDCIFVLHDAAVSFLRWPRGVRAVYAYEDGALATFRRASKRGIARIWDLPTPHHSFLPSLRREEQRRWPDLALGHVQEPGWKLARKDGELAEASAVCVASRFTLSTLPETALSRPVVVVPYGFPASSFPARTGEPRGPFLALSVGTQSVRKGTHYLLTAWKKAGLRDAKLRLVGPMRLDRRFLAQFDGLFEHVPHVPRSHLSREYCAADLLVFPTLGDGFGLVIQEAMCSGTPVLTTPCGGGPECLNDGKEGWIVPSRDTDALVEALRQAALDRGSLFRMGQAARRRAEAWTWRDAARKLVTDLASSGLL